MDPHDVLQTVVYEGAQLVVNVGVLARKIRLDGVGDWAGWRRLDPGLCLLISRLMRDDKTSCFLCWKLVKK